jgi:hypothetical protein
MNIKTIAAIAAVLVCALMASAQASAAQIDSKLFAMFSLNGHASISFVVCGSLPETNGCYGSTNLRPPFEAACAVLQGTPNYNGDVVTRDIYVLDKRSSAKTAVQLYIYQRQDTITNSSDAISVTLEHTIALPIKGGLNADCAMAGNNAAVYAGTTKDTVAVSIDKKTQVVKTLGGFSPPAKLLAITADDRGYIALHFAGGFYIIDPKGNGGGDGGGSASMINTRNGWVPK